MATFIERLTADDLADPTSVRGRRVEDLADFISGADDLNKAPGKPKRHVALAFVQRTLREGMTFILSLNDHKINGWSRSETEGEREAA